MSLITIRFTDTLLRYDGLNYQPDGTYRRGFVGTSQPLGTIDGPTVWFDYDSSHGDNGVFSAGKTSSSFESFDQYKHRYMCFEGHAQDVGHTELIPMFGYRAHDDDAWAFKSWSSDDARRRRSELARQAFEERRNEITTFVPKSKR